jgi:hypothetical protein
VLKELGSLVMKVEVSWPRLLLVVLVGIGLTESALACNELSANAKAQERTPDNRTFILDLDLDKSGSVRGVQVLMGSGPLRSEAIKAAARQRYLPGNSAMTAVEVRFSRDKDRRPKVHEVSFGVSSCIPGGAPIEWPMIRWVNRLLSNQFPLLLPATDSNE